MTFQGLLCLPSSSASYRHYVHTQGVFPSHRKPRPSSSCSPGPGDTELQCPCSWETAVRGFQVQRLPGLQREAMLGNLTGNPISNFKNWKRSRDITQSQNTGSACKRLQIQSWECLPLKIPCPDGAWISSCQGLGMKWVVLSPLATHAVLSL